MKKLLSILVLFLCSIAYSTAENITITTKSGSSGTGTWSASSGSVTGTVALPNELGNISFSLPKTGSDSNNIGSNYLTWKKNETLTITMPTGVTISDIELTFTAQDKGPANSSKHDGVVADNISCSLGTFAAVGSSTTVFSTSGTAANSVTITNTMGGEFRMTQIILTYAAGPVDPVFSLSTSDLQVGETAKILVGGEDIFADNFTAGTLWESDGYGPYITLSADGTITAVKNTPANYYFTFFGTSKDATKYNSKSSGNLSLTIATKYAISTTTPENGSITASATSAPEGDEVTLTAIPDFRYAFSAWNVYKTGEPATTVTVTDNKFTMPAYAVTVDATFAADTKKQVLYVTSDGNVNASDDLYAALGEDYTVTVAANSASKTVTDFDLVVLHESIGGKDGTSGLAAAAKAGDVPVLNTKSYFYNSGRWGWGEPNAGGTVNGCSQNVAYSNVASHPIFNGVTVTDGFVQVVGTAAAKAMQPVGTIEEGYEGYLLATSPNASSGKGAAIHELTAADRGVASAKYIMISVSNACLNDLTANGQLLFKNAAAYLMSDEAWTPTLATTNITLNAKGYGTYSKANDFTFSGATGYKMALDEDAATITGTAVTGKIAAGEGILFKGEPNAEVTITGATWATALDGNDLVGTTTASGTKAEKPSICYTLSGDTFKKFVGTEFNDNKAYIEGTTELNSLDIVFEDEQATAVDAIAEADEAKTVPVKVIKNGKLYIGNFNVAGQQVK